MPIRLIVGSLGTGLTHAFLVYHRLGAVLVVLGFLVAAGFIPTMMAVGAAVRFRIVRIVSGIGITDRLAILGACHIDILVGDIILIHAAVFLLAVHNCMVWLRTAMKRPFLEEFKFKIQNSKAWYGGYVENAAIIALHEEIRLVRLKSAGVHGGEPNSC